MDFSRFTTFSFDCYGTLIDWESGILPVLRGVLDNHGQSLPDAEILKLYGEFEAEAESGAYQSYREVLQSVVLAFAARFHFHATPAEISSLDESLPSWQPFPDTIAALREMQDRYQLVVISNIDDDLFAATQKRLGIDFYGVVTAERARSYKPSTNNFEMALRTFALAPEKLLHVGQSIYHDVVPAKWLGISTVWVNRKSARPGLGPVLGSTGSPDLEVADLASLAAAISTQL